METATFVWLRLGLSPEDDTVVERDIVPVNWSILVRVTSVKTEEPSARVKVVDPAEIVKSTILTVTVVAWDSVPDAAVTVTVKVDAIEEETVKVDMPGPAWDIVTVPGFKIAVNPGADALVTRVKVPEKPLTPLTMMVEFARDPTSAIMKGCVDEMVKSTTLTEIVVE